LVVSRAQEAFPLTLYYNKSILFIELFGPEVIAPLTRQWVFGQKIDFP